MFISRSPLILLHGSLTTARLISKHILIPIPPLKSSLPRKLIIQPEGLQETARKGQTPRTRILAGDAPTRYAIKKKRSSMAHSGSDSSRFWITPNRKAMPAMSLWNVARRDAKARWVPSTLLSCRGTPRWLPTEVLCCPFAHVFSLLPLVFAPWLPPRPPRLLDTSQASQGRRGAVCADSRSEWSQIPLRKYLEANKGPCPCRQPLGDVMLFLHVFATSCMFLRSCAQTSL